MRVPKRSFVFLQRNTKFYSCTQTASHSLFYSEIRNFTIASKRLFVFDSTMRKFTVVPKWPYVFVFFFTAKYKILKTVPKRPYVLSLRNTRILKLHQNSFRFWITKYKIWNCTLKRTFVFLTTNSENRI